MRVLLDTDVLSQIQRPQGSPQVKQRVAEIAPEHLFLSAITFGEVIKGVSLLQPSDRRTTLAQWLLGLEQRFADRILPVDVEVARLWGELTARAQTQGFQIPTADGLIAATALRHGLHIMTRNNRHFALSGAPIIDPWES